MAIVFAPVKPIRLVRGTRWQDQVQLVDKETGDPVDLTGITALILTIRQRIDGPAIMELDLDGGLAIANALLGLVDIDVSSDDTLQFPESSLRRAKYVYDAMIERAPGWREPAFAGKLTVLPSITRPWAAP